MKVWGLTGGVGMGKSTAAEISCVHGAQVVDTDEISRHLVEPGQPALAEIEKEFGDVIISSVGELKRDELARIVFADTGARKKLETILHPRIRKRWLAQIENWRKENYPLAIVVIPLLYETHAESQFDKIICVACSAASQQTRLLQRGWSPEQIQQRIAAQMSIDQKIARADFVVWTDGNLDAHREQLGRIFQMI